MSTMRVKKLYISKKVPANTMDITTTFTPLVDEIIRVIKFVGAASFSQDAIVRVSWDVAGVDENIWSIEGEQPMPKEIADVFQKTGNGVKKVGICLQNDSGAGVFLSGFAIIEVETPDP